MSWDLLSLPTTQGGLGAPDLKLYALCAQAQFLHFWVHQAPYQPQVAVEKQMVMPTPPSVALYRPYKCTPDCIDTTETLRWAWDGLRRRAGARCYMLHLYL